MNDGVNFSQQVINEIEKHLREKKQYFKIIDSFIIPSIIVFFIFCVTSTTLLIYCGTKINEYISNNNLTFFTQSNTVLNFLNLWSNTNLISIIVGNISAIISVFISTISLMELIGYLKKKNKTTHQKKITLFCSLIFFLVTSIFVFYFINTSNLPIWLDYEKLKFKMFTSGKTNPLFSFLIFSNGGYDNLLQENNTTSNIDEGNYFNFLISYISSITIICFVFIFYFSITFVYEMNQNDFDKKSLYDSLDKSISQKIIEVKAVENLNSDNYFEKQQSFFVENKNKIKKMPNEISFTQEIDLNKKELKKLTVVETEDKDNITPTYNIKIIERLKNKKKIDDLFVKEI